MKKLLLTALLLLPLAAQAKTETYQFDNSVALNMVQIRIEAPIETTRAQGDVVRGSLKIDDQDLMKTRGTIEFDVASLKSYSFSSESKNASQTEHMLNWFEIDKDVPLKKREKYRWAEFTINKITKVKVMSDKIQDEIGRGKSYQITAEGTFTLHGKKANKTIALSVLLYDVSAAGQRYQAANRVAIIRTREPFEVSMKEHEIHPRSATGSILNKALKVIGLKISDTVEVSLDLRAFVGR